MVVWFLRTEPLIFNCFCNKHLREQFKIFIDWCQWSERNINDSANSFKTNKEQTNAKSLRKKKIKWDEKLLVSSANISWEYFHFRRRISKRYCCAQTNTHWFRDWTAKHEYYWEDAGKKKSLWCGVKFAATVNILLTVTVSLSCRGGQWLKKWFVEAIE